jgi:hypothetical protein
MAAVKPGPRDTKLSGAEDSGEFVETILLNRYLKLVVGRGPGLTRQMPNTRRLFL